MTIRKATYHDASAVKYLLEASGCTARLSILLDRLETMFDKEDHQVFVYERRGEVIGLVSVHYLPQLAFDGGLMIVSYFSIDKRVTDSNVARELERYVAEQAKLRQCERIQVFCMDCPGTVRKFYLQQGYQECPNYFTKKLVHGE